MLEFSQYIAAFCYFDNDFLSAFCCHFEVQIECYDFAVLFFTLKSRYIVRCAHSSVLRRNVRYNVNCVNNDGFQTAKNYTVESASFLHLWATDLEFAERVER